MVGSWPCQQTLDQTGNACHGNHSSLNYGCKKFYNIGPMTRKRWFSFSTVGQWTASLEIIIKSFYGCNLHTGQISLSVRPWQAFQYSLRLIFSAKAKHLLQETFDQVNKACQGQILQLFCCIHKITAVKSFIKLSLEPNVIKLSTIIIQEFLQ